MNELPELTFEGFIEGKVIFTLTELREARDVGALIDGKLAELKEQLTEKWAKGKEKGFDALWKAGE